jgi:lipoate---protein ligase
MPVVGRRATWAEVDRPSLVLGSTQPLDAVDAAVAATWGVTVARRRSGGSAVLLWPGEHLWLDVDVPRGDRLWDDDVGRSMNWLGEVWVEALAGLGVTAEVHRGPMVRTDWSGAVCFAGLGPGEVHADGAKLVGISQRRTRDGARLQCACHLRWRPEAYAELLALSPDSGLDGAAAVVAASAVDIRTAVAEALAPR